MEDKHIIIILSILLSISIIVGIVLKRITDDLVLTNNGYKSDREVCKVENEELINENKRLAKELEDR